MNMGGTCQVISSSFTHGRCSGNAMCGLNWKFQLNVIMRRKKCTYCDIQ